MNPSPQPLAPDRELQVIVLEDVMWDAELIQRQLKSLERKCCFHHCTDQPAYVRALASINPDLIVFEISCRAGTGIDAWCDWLVEHSKQ